MYSKVRNEQNYSVHATPSWRLGTPNRQALYKVPQLNQIEADLWDDKDVSNMWRELTEVKEMAVKLKGYSTRNQEL